jgi:hypothetical protein
LHLIVFFYIYFGRGEFHYRKSSFSWWIKGLHDEETATFNKYGFFIPSHATFKNGGLPKVGCKKLGTLVSFAMSVLPRRTGEVVNFAKKDQDIIQSDG